MAKKKPSDTMTPPTFKPPSLNDQLKWAADSVARTAVENHPKVKRLHNHIAKAVSKAAKQAMRKQTQGGPVGY